MYRIARMGSHHRGQTSERRYPFASYHQLIKNPGRENNRKVTRNQQVGL